MSTMAQDRGRVPVPWLTVGLLAVLTAYADGFALTSLRGAIGAIERTQEPYRDWLRDSTLLLPVFAVVVFLALRYAVRRFGPGLRGFRPLLGASLLVAAACTVLGTVAVAANTAYDYHLQSKQLGVIHAAHTTTPTSQHQHAAVPSDPDCDLICHDRRTMLAVDVRAVVLAAGVLGVANLFLVGWVAAARGGRLVR